MIIAGLLIACRNKNSNEASAEITNGQLKQIIIGFVDFLLHSNEEERTITISFKQNQDTIALAIVNSYPDLSLAKINGIAVINGYRICLVGTYPEENFYKVNRMINIPEDIVAVNKSYEHPEHIRDIKEPSVWFLYFKKGNLVDYSPGQEINAFVPKLHRVQ